jgi:hypothetical protein
MTDKRSFADKARDHATDDDSSHAHQVPDRRRWTDVLKHRWPTALGVAVGVLTVFDLQGGTELAALTMLMPVVYLGAAALDRRRFAWAVLFAGVAVLTVVPSTSQVVDGPSRTCSGRSLWGSWASPSPCSSIASSARRRSAFAALLMARAHERARPPSPSRRPGVRGLREADRSPKITGGRPYSDIGCLQVSEASKFRGHGARRDESVWTRR